MGMKRRKYDLEFRKEAVRLASKPDVTATKVERNLGLYQGAIGKWRQELETDPVNSFPGNGKM